VPSVLLFVWQCSRRLRITRFARFVSPLLFGEQLAYVDVAGVDSGWLMNWAIGHCAGLHVASESVVPFGRCVMGHSQLRCIPALEQLEREGDANVVYVLGELLVQ